MPSLLLYIKGLSVCFWRCFLSAKLNLQLFAIGAMESNFNAAYYLKVSRTVMEITSSLVIVALTV